jgi:hypothetical protein
MRVGPLLVLLFLGLPIPKPEQLHKGRNSSPVRIGTAATIHGGIRISAEEIRRFLQRGPSQVLLESGELIEEHERPRSRAPAPNNPVPLNATPPMPDPISPLPSIQWLATNGVVTPAAAAVNLTPPDPQIAVSSTHVVLGLNGALYMYTKDGKPYPSPNNVLCIYLNCTKNFFQPIISGANLGLPQNGNIDSFSDLRVNFDPYRKRFLAVATGAFRGQVLAARGRRDLLIRQQAAAEL